jgi:hypothetical protein
VVKNSPWQWPETLPVWPDDAVRIRMPFYYNTDRYYPGQLELPFDYTVSDRHVVVGVDRGSQDGDATVIGRYDGNRLTIEKITNEAIHRFGVSKIAEDLLRENYLADVLWGSFKEHWTPPSRWQRFKWSWGERWLRLRPALIYWWTGRIEEDDACW